MERQRGGIRFFEIGARQPASFSTAVRFGDLIFTAGLVGADPGGQPVDFPTQVRVALGRLIEAVEAAGGGPETLLKVTAYLARIDDWPVYDEVYRSVLTVDPKPARTSVAVAQFMKPVQIELEAVAAVRKTAG